MGQTWLVDPQTGDYVMDDKGKPTLVRGLKVPAYIRLKTRRLTWLYAPDDNFGSDFHLVGKRLTTRDSSLVQNIAGRALQPVVDDGRASEVQLSPLEVTRHTELFNTKIFDAQGEPEEFEFSPIIGGDV